MQGIALVGVFLRVTPFAADRSPDVEMEARGSKLYLLRKPVKPAALRSLMTRLYHGDLPGVDDRAQ